MDLSKLVAENNEVELVIPGIGPIGFFVSLRHESAPEVQKVNKQFQSKIMEDARKGNKNRATISEWYKTEKPLAHISGWRWTNLEFNYNGEQPEFTREKASEMLNGKGLFSYNFKNLIDENVADEESFLAKYA